MGITAGEKVHRQRNHHEEQAELRHRAGDGAQQDAERGCRKEIDGGAEQKERDGAADWHTQQALDDNPYREPRGDDDDETIRPYFGQHDLGRL